jgi:PadR family transcriptional regulator PadR
LLVLQSLLGGSRHGYAIAQRIRQLSDDVLALGESSLYTSLQRLLLNGWVKAEWGASENNRRARYYTLTSQGRKHLKIQTQEFELVVGAIQRVLRAV